MPDQPILPPGTRPCFYRVPGGPEVIQDRGYLDGRRKIVRRLRNTRPERFAGMYEIEWRDALGMTTGVHVYGVNRIGRAIEPVDPGRWHDV